MWLPMVLWACAIAAACSPACRATAAVATAGHDPRRESVSALGALQEMEGLPV